MNFKIYNKVQALPMKSTIKGTLLNLAFHCNPKKDNLCHPKWDTIQEETGISRDAIKKALRLSKAMQIIEIRHRGDIKTGKLSDQYFFKFDGINFYKSDGKWKLSKENQMKFKQKLKQTKETLEEQDRKDGKKKRSAFADKSTYTTTSNNPDIRTFHKSQKSYIEPSYTKGSKDYWISPDIRSINPHIGPEVIDTNTKLSTSNITDTHLQESCKDEKQKTVWQEVKEEKHSKNENNIFEIKKSPKEQTNEEWLADYDNKKK